MPKNSTNGRHQTHTLKALGQTALATVGRFAPEGAAWLAERVFLRPRRLERPTRERSLLARAKRFEVPFEGQRLAAWEWGRGERAVLLVHGWSGRGAQLGSFVEPLVAAGLRVVAFDAPAHGDSPGREIALVPFSRAVLAVAEAAGPVHGVVAHSFGAAATTIALSRGLDAEAAVFLAPFAEIEVALARFERMFALGPAAAQAFRARIERRNGARAPELEGRTLARGMRARLLVVHDEEDRDVPIGAGAALARAWAGARFEATQGLGHHRVLRRPEVIEKATAFLTGRPAPSALRELEQELFHRHLRYPKRADAAGGLA